MTDGISLKEHFETRLNDQKSYFESLRTADKDAIAIALASAKEAVAVAERNAEKWRDNANEWREAMNDRENKFMPRAEFDAYKESAQMALGIEKTRGDVGHGKSLGLSQGWGYLVGGIGLAMGIISFLT